MKKQENYEFGIKENKKIGYKGILLKDKTQIIFYKNELSIMLPKDKFSEIFKKQLKNKKGYNKTHIGITFSKTELKAIENGFKELFKKGGINKMEKYTFVLDVETDKKNILSKLGEAIDKVLSNRDNFKLDLVDENNIRGITLTY